MHRHTIRWSQVPSQIILRGCTNTNDDRIEPVQVKPPVAVAATFPDELGHPVQAAPPPPPDIRPLLEAIAGELDAMEQRRKQSLSELQQVALELAISVASHLVHVAIENEQFAVEKLVEQAVRSLGLDTAAIIWLHPDDLQLLQKRLTQVPALWNPEQMTFRGDPGISRGGCRAEGGSGRILVSDISLRLSEIRRHWMEELDDTQVERRRSAGEGPPLRRFPDRRETA